MNKKLILVITCFILLFSACTSHKKCETYTAADSQLKDEEKKEIHSNQISGSAPPTLQKSKRTDSSTLYEAEGIGSYSYDVKELEHNTESYSYIKENDFLAATENPLSTFSIDVDGASYSNCRRYIKNGGLPPEDAVRIEEFINYFDYHYQKPTG